MSSYRIERVNSMLRSEISQVFIEEVKNPLFEKITITAVQVTKDLSMARVFYSCFEGDPKDLERSLNSAASFVRGILKKRLKIKRVPELVFKHDTSFEYGEHIERLLKDITHEHK